MDQIYIYLGVLFGAFIGYLKLENKTIIVCSLPLINIIFDIFVMHTGGGESLIDVFRGVFTILLIMVFFVRNVKFNIITVSVIFYISFVLILLIARTGGLFQSIGLFSFYLKVFIPLLILPVAYYTINTERQINYLNSFTLSVTIIFIGYVLMANIFGFGGNMYVRNPELIEQSSWILTGALGGNSMNVLSYGLILSPLIILYKGNKTRLIILATIVAGIAILLLVFRRSALIIVIVSFLIYVVNIRYFKKEIRRFILLGGIVMLMMSPILIDLAYQALELRGRHVISASFIQEESRAVENRIVLEYIFSFKNGIDSLFGESFSFKSNVGYGRPLHSDHTIILSHTGIIGLTLYLFIFLSIYLTYKNLKKYSPNKVYNLTFWALLITCLLLSYPGRFSSLTFRTIIFLYIGGILGFFYNRKLYFNQIHSSHQNV